MKIIAIIAVIAVVAFVLLYFTGRGRGVGGSFFDRFRGRRF